MIGRRRDRSGRSRVPAALLVAALLLATAGSAAAAKRPAAKPAAAKPAPAPPPAPAPDPWHSARSLADAAQYDSALAVLHAAQRERGDDLDLRWLEAGITGEAGRHREAVTLYEKLAADHPERAEDLRGDLANERLWADDSRGAVRDYRGWIGTHPDDSLAMRRLALALARSDSLAPALAAYDTLLRAHPDDTGLALERARVLSWMDRHDEAIAAYREILARDSTNANAKLGLAMNENWSGRHRSATRHLESLSREPGADPEAGKALAFARYWDDDPDGARLALDQYLSTSPDDREALDLSRRIESERRPTLTLRIGRADDSDGLRVVSPDAELSWPFTYRTTGTIGWHRDNVSDATGMSNPRALSVGLRHRFAPEVTGYGRYAAIDWGGGPGTSPCGELGAIVRPIDRLRVEGLVEREPVLTRISLERGISMLSWVATVDYAATERLALHAGGRAGYYSDQNREERTSALARYRTWNNRHTEVALTFSVDQLNTRLDLDNGYYDPDFHREWAPGAEVEWRPDNRWVLGGHLRTGWQRDKGGPTEPYYDLGGRVELIPDAWWRLALEAGRSDSNLQTQGGYRRAWWQFTVSRGF